MELTDPISETVDSSLPRHDEAGMLGEAFFGTELVWRVMVADLGQRKVVHLVGRQLVLVHLYPVSEMTPVRYQNIFEKEIT